MIINQNKILETDNGINIVEGMPITFQTKDTKKYKVRVESLHSYGIRATNVEEITGGKREKLQGPKVFLFCDIENTTYEVVKTDS